LFEYIFRSGWDVAIALTRSEFFTVEHTSVKEGDTSIIQLSGKNHLAIGQTVFSTNENFRII